MGREENAKETHSKETFMFPERKNTILKMEIKTRGAGREREKG